MGVKPTMREKRRYLGFRIEADGRLSGKEAEAGVLKGILSFIGELGFAKANPKLIRFDPESGIGILRCNVPKVERVQGALSLVNSIGGKKAAIRLLGVSGSIKKLGKKANKKAI